MNTDHGHIVAIKRAPFYNDADYRELCRDMVINDFAKGINYNYGGIEKYAFPWAQEKPNTDYCSQLVDHYYYYNSGEKFNVGKGSDDHVVPYAIQRCAELSDVQKTNGIWQIREMDTVLVTSGTALAEVIRVRTAGIEHAFDMNVATHAGIVIFMEGRWWIAEMLETSTISSFNKYTP